MSWVERYRPRGLDDVVGHVGVVSFLKRVVGVCDVVEWCFYYGVVLIRNVVRSHAGVAWIE